MITCCHSFTDYPVLPRESFRFGVAQSSVPVGSEARIRGTLQSTACGRLEASTVRREVGRITRRRSRIHTAGGQRRIGTTPTRTLLRRRRDSSAGTVGLPRYGCHTTSAGTPPSHDRTLAAALRRGGGSVPFFRKPSGISEYAFERRIFSRGDERAPDSTGIAVPICRASRCASNESQPRASLLADFCMRGNTEVRASCGARVYSVGGGGGG